MGSSDKGLRVIGVFIVKNQFLVPTITKTITKFVKRGLFHLMIRRSSHLF
jgi:hypothetical protein